MESLTMFLVRMVTLRSPYTRDHSNRVRKRTVELAKHIRSPFDEIRLLEYAAVFHDIGKLAISECILNKPACLTEEEHLTMQQHTIIGHKLLRPLGFGSLICGAALYHHENYDGTGYPAGLVGDAIPLVARMIRITDSYDSLTNVRPYRPAYAPDRAIEILKEDRRYFDPFLFNEFLKMLTEMD